MTVGCPPSTAAMTEFVVPRSIPTALAMVASQDVSGSVTRELIHERLEGLGLLAQQAAEGANEVLGRRATVLDERVEPVEETGRHRAVLLEGTHDCVNGPVSHAITVAPHCGARHHVNAWFRRSAVSGAQCGQRSAERNAVSVCQA